MDSEDIPLSLSREGMQDSRLMQKIRDVLTRRLLRYFDEQSKTDPGKFTQFVKEYSAFFKEGIVTEQSGRYKVRHVHCVVSVSFFFCVCVCVRAMMQAWTTKGCFCLGSSLSGNPPESKQLPMRGIAGLCAAAV